MEVEGGGWRVGVACCCLLTWRERDELVEAGDVRVPSRESDQIEQQHVAPL